MSKTQALPIDTRIIKTQYKNYDLLARYWNGRYRGRIWKNKVKMADYTGESIDLILESLVQIVNQLRERQYNERDDETITMNDYVAAWHTIIPRMDRGLLAALTTMARYKTNSASINRLQKIVGCDGAEEVLKVVDKTEHALRLELLLELYVSPPKVNPLCTYASYDVNGPPNSKLLVINEPWSQALLQANVE